MEIDTWIIHSSGHMLRWTFEATGDGPPQALGSLITYARRYCGQAALGIAPERGADDDGQKAQEQATRPPPEEPPIPPFSTQDPLTRKAMALFRAAAIIDRDVRLRITGEIVGRTLDSWGNLTGKERRQVVDELERRARDADDEEDGRTAQADDEEDTDAEPAGGVG
jgi:hypothetical protein